MRKSKHWTYAFFVDNAKVMSKGQITIPKDVRKVLGVASGDRITFIVEGNTVRNFFLVPKTANPPQKRRSFRCFCGGSFIFS